MQRTRPPPIIPQCVEGMHGLDRRCKHYHESDERIPHHRFDEAHDKASYFFCLLQVPHIHALSPNKSDGQSDSPRPTTNELSKKMPGRPPELETGFRPGTHEKQQSHRERALRITHSRGTVSDAECEDTVCLEKVLERGARHCEETMHALSPSFAPIRLQNARITLASLMAMRPCN